MADEAPLEDLVARVRPATVVLFDIEGEPPEISGDDRYLDAWVVACEGTHPRSMKVVDLTKGPQAVAEQLEEIAYECRRGQVPPASTVPESELPRITVVVPTIGQRLDELDTCMESLLAQDYPLFDVILVDNRRDVPTPDPLSIEMTRWPAVQMIRETTPGVSAARNRGIANSRGSIIAFTDDDVQVGDGWLRRIGVEFARDHQLDLLTGLILPSELETPAQIWFEYYYGGFAGERLFAPVTLTTRRLRAGRFDVSDDDGDRVDSVALYGVGAYGAGANTAYRTSTLRALGGFDEALGTGTPSQGGEDIAMFMRILWRGGRIRYQPDVYVMHRHRREYEALVRQLEGYGIGFTAVLTSLIIRDPRHLVTLAKELGVESRQLVRRLLRNARGRNRTKDVQMSERQFPSELARREYRGYLKGPGAYLRSRRRGARA